MAMLLQLGKRKWLAGMHWVTYQTAPKKTELLADADRIATRPKNPIDVDLVTLRVGKQTIQAGFSEEPEVEAWQSSAIARLFAPKKSYSLAAMLADSTKQPWLGIFKLDEDLFWFIAVRDGNGILPDGDLIGTAEEIEAARDKYTGLNQDWEYVKGDREFLEEMLAEVESKPTLVKELPSDAFPWKPVCATVVLLTAAAGGGWMYHHMKEADKQRMLAELRRKTELAKKNQPVGPSNAQLLQQAPAPGAWLAACQSAIYGTPLSHGGWSFSAVSCIGKQATIIWKRSPGATIDVRPEGVLDATGEQVVQVKSLSVATVPGVVTAPVMQQAELALRSWAQHRSINVKIEAPTQDSKTVLPAGQQAVLVEPRRSVSFDVISPFMFGSEMDLLPGFRIESVKPAQTYETSGLWAVQGVIYGS